MASDDNLPVFSDIDIFEMKLKLEHEKAPQLLDTMRTLVNWGNAASPLVPDLIKHYRSGKLRGFETCLVDLWLDTGSKPLLGLLHEYQIILGMDISRQCRLLEAGVQEVERKLIDYLYQHATSVDIFRSEIALTLGRSGGHESYMLIRVLLPKVAEMVNAYSVSHPEGMVPGKEIEESEEDTRELLEAIDYSAHAQFVDVLKEALRTLEARGMHEPGKNQ
jgi:hypothetical protein